MVHRWKFDTDLISDQDHDQSDQYPISTSQHCDYNKFAKMNHGFIGTKPKPSPRLIYEPVAHSAGKFQ